MTDDAKCRCGHNKNDHVGGVLGCHYPPWEHNCLCSQFRPAEEVKPPTCPDCGPGVKSDDDGCCAHCGADIDSAQNPVPESVYERARAAVRDTVVLYKGSAELEALDLATGDLIEEALDAGEKAEQHAESAERERDVLKAQNANLIEVLILADGAMNYMGDQLNDMDACDPEDETAVTPAFTAVRAALAEAKRCSPKMESPKGES